MATLYSKEERMKLELANKYGLLSISNVFILESAY